MTTANMSDENRPRRNFIDLENRSGAHNYHPLDVVIERAEGVWVYDTDGTAISTASPRTRP